MTGDGKADAIVINTNSPGNYVVVRRSTGTGFGPNEPWIPEIPYYGTKGTYFADVNGDRMADAIVVNDNSPGNYVVVRWSTGAGFLPNAVYISDAPYYGQYGTVFRDVNGDGKVEIIAINPDGIWVRAMIAPQGK